MSCLIYDISSLSSPRKEIFPENLITRNGNPLTETFCSPVRWSVGNNEMRQRSGKNGKKTALKRNNEQLINMLESHSTKPLFWINMLIPKKAVFFPVLDKHEVSGVPVLVINKLSGNFSHRRARFDTKRRLFPFNTFDRPLKASNKVDRSQLVWYEPIPGSAKKSLGSFFLRCRPSWNLGPKWLDKNL